jgi:hypothetical protein
MFCEFAKVVGELWRAMFDAYQPELHYMRGRVPFEGTFPFSASTHGFARVAPGEAGGLATSIDFRGKGH